MAESGQLANEVDNPGEKMRIRNGLRVAVLMLVLFVSTGSAADGHSAAVYLVRFSAELNLKMASSASPPAS